MAVPDHFALLGLPRTFALDADALEQAFLAASRQTHPDYYTQGSAAEQADALAQAAVVNEAYATLRHPFKRADYLLRLLGGPSASDQKEMPPDFLEAVLELRMEIEEVRDSGDAERRAALEQDLQSRRQALFDEVGRGFAQLGAPPAAAALLAIRKNLNSIKYIDNLLRELSEP